MIVCLSRLRFFLILQCCTIGKLDAFYYDVLSRTRCKAHSSHIVCQVRVTRLRLLSVLAALFDRITSTLRET